MPDSAASSIIAGPAIADLVGKPVKDADRGSSIDGDRVVVSGELSADIVPPASK